MSPITLLIQHLFRALLAATLAAGGLAPQPQAAQALRPLARPQAAISVTTLDDELNSDGDCALREAVAAANTNLAVDACPAGEGGALDSISFAISGTLTLTLGLTVTAGGPLEISGGQVITISGAGGVRPFYVETGADLALEGLALLDGAADDGGAIYSQGALALAQVVLQGNAASGYGGALYAIGDTVTISASQLISNTALRGGGIYNETALVLDGTLLRGNAAAVAGGGIFNANAGALSLLNSTLDGNRSEMAGGGLFNELLATLEFANNTLVGNSAAEFGGGMYNSGPAEIVHATFYDNSAGFGGALYATNTTIIYNSLLAGSPSGGNCSGTLPEDGGYNLDSEDSCNFDPLNGSQVNADPLLYLPLGDYGGPAPTLPLLPVSPAIDAAGEAACLPLDQRGEPRPADGNADGTAACDIGAFELQLGVLVVTTLADELNEDGDCALREALTAAETNLPVDACGAGTEELDLVRFEVQGVINLSSSLPELTQAGGAVLVDGGRLADDSNAITLDGGNAFTVLRVGGGGMLGLRNVTVMDGSGTGTNGGGLTNAGGLAALEHVTFSGNQANLGGAVFNAGVLLVVNSQFSANSATLAGGAIASGVMLIVANSSFNGNSAFQYGGGLFSTTGPTTLYNSTFSGNTVTFGSGGGIYLNDSTASLTNLTLSGNSAFFNGGGIYNNTGAITLTNTIVANSGSGGNCGGAIMDGGYNIDSANTCGFSAANGSMPDTNPILGGLVDNGGPTLTHAILEGSPAIDAADAVACLPTDQRGMARFGPCDIGAYEHGGTLTSLSAAPSPSQRFEPVTLTATVEAGQEGTPTGVVTFSTALGPLGSAALDADGQAVLVTAELPLGLHLLGADYSGDADFAPSSALPVVHWVLQAETFTSITSDLPDPSWISQTFTVTFAVTASYGAPTGTVQLTISGRPETCQVDLVDGQGACPFGLPEAGQYTLTAAYAGTPVFLPSVDREMHTITLERPTVTTILADLPDPSYAGQPFTVSVSVSSTFGTPTGALTVTAALSGSPAAAICVTALTGGLASCPLALAGSGLYTLQADYAGDADFAPSSATDAHTVLLAPTFIGMNDSPDPSLAGQPFTVTLALTSDYGVPGEVITVTASLSGGLPAVTCVAKLEAGAALSVLNLDAAGEYLLQAEYGGDQGFAPSSAQAAHTVQAAQITYRNFLPLVLGSG